MIVVFDSNEGKAHISLRAVIHIQAYSSDWHSGVDAQRVSPVASRIASELVSAQHMLLMFMDQLNNKLWTHWFSGSTPIAAEVCAFPHFALLLAALLSWLCCILLQAIC